MIAKTKHPKSSEPAYRPRIAVGNTDRGVLEEIRRTYGGMLENHPAQREGWKDAYVLIWSEGMVESLLKRILPHVRVKARQAHLILRLVAHKKRTRRVRKGHRYFPFRQDVVAVRESIYRQLRQLNAKGPLRE